MTHGPEPRSPAGAAGLAGRGGAAAVASSGSPHGSWKERENICALKRWRRRGGDPHHLPPTAPRGGGTHPGAEQVAARFLDAADKVPSFRLEQKLTPEEGEFRSPVGGGLGRRGPHSWLPSSSARKALGQVPAPPRAGALAEQAVWEAASAEHQGRNGTRALSRGPHPRDATLQTTESGAAREALTWGTTWRARSRGRPLAPSSADPRSRRSTLLCPVGLWGAETLPCPHPATPPGPACPPGWKQTGGSQVAFS